MKRHIIPAVLLPILLIGCSPYAHQLESIPVAEKRPDIPTTEKACATAGGHWTRLGLSMRCDIKTTDGRKICTNGIQCEGGCLVAESIPAGSKAIGSCSEWMSTFGCHKFIDGKGIVAEVCAD